MKDDRLISLNAAIDAMMKLQTEDIEAYGASIPEGFDGDRAVTAIKALQSAQPEIIHCKDCKYNPNPPECGNAACVLFYGMTDQMGFCHHGERRERE